MDLFTGLLLIQKDTQILVLKQYQYGLLLDACAVKLGARPPHMVTLYSGVLGRPVYSALKEEDTQSGAGQSAEDQRRTAEMLYMMLNKGGKFIDQGQILFDPNLSNSEKSEKWLSTAINDAGGPVPFIGQALFGLSAITGTIGTAYIKGRKWYNESGEGKLKKKLNEVIEKKNVKTLVNGIVDAEAQIDAIANAYETAQDNIQTLQAFVGELDTPVNVKDIQPRLIQLVNSLPANQQFSQLIATWLWQFLKNGSFLLQGGKIDPTEIKVDRLDPKQQGKIGQMIKSFNGCLGLNLNIPALSELEQLAPQPADPVDNAKLDSLKQKMYAAIKGNTENLLIVFRNESLILRFVLQELIK
jgi:hypothetical protein